MPRKRGEHQREQREGAEQRRALRGRRQFRSTILQCPDARDRLILVDRRDGVTHRRDDRRRVHRGTNDDAAIQVPDLIALFVHAIHRRLGLAEDAVFRDLIHHADDRMYQHLSPRFPNLNR